MTTLWSPNVADAVEKIRRLCSDGCERILNYQEDDSLPGVTPIDPGDNSRLERSGYAKILEVLDGFQKTYPIKATIIQAKGKSSLADR